MSRLRDLFTLGSRVRYLIWRLSKSSAILSVRLKQGLVLLLRPSSSTDLATANEVFVGCVYQLPVVSTTPIRHIADLGANVGYSLLWWLQQFPDSRITAYEPLPLHCQQIHEQLALNNFTKRVLLWETAAGVHEGIVNLLSAENQTSVVEAPTGLTVSVRDVYADLSEVDLLKIDIEGSEYDILADSRFETLRPSVIVLEWHLTSDSRSGSKWCENRLTALGYSVTHTLNADSHGVIWGILQ